MESDNIAELQVMAAAEDIVSRLNNRIVEVAEDIAKKHGQCGLISDLEKCRYMGKTVTLNALKPLDEIQVGATEYILDEAQRRQDIFNAPPDYEMRKSRLTFGYRVRRFIGRLVIPRND